MANTVDEGNQRWQRYANVIGWLGSEVSQTYLEKFAGNKHTTLEAEVQKDRSKLESVINKKHLFNDDGALKPELDITNICQIAKNLSLTSAQFQKWSGVANDTVLTWGINGEPHEFNDDLFKALRLLQVLRNETTFHNPRLSIPAKDYDLRMKQAKAAVLALAMEVERFGQINNEIIRIEQGKKSLEEIENDAKRFSIDFPKDKECNDVKRLMKDTEFTKTVVDSADVDSITITLWSNGVIETDDLDRIKQHGVERDRRTELVKVLQKKVVTIERMGKVMDAFSQALQQHIAENMQKWFDAFRSSF